MQQLGMHVTCFMCRGDSLMTMHWSHHCSVRYLKSVNTYNSMGKRVAVNAQQYAVLVTNVHRVCYPELLPAHRCAVAHA